MARCRSASTGSCTSTQRGISSQRRQNKSEYGHHDGLCRRHGRTGRRTVNCQPCAVVQGFSCRERGDNPGSSQTGYSGVASDGGSDASAQVRLLPVAGRTPHEESEAPADGCVGVAAGAAAEADGPTKFTSSVKTRLPTRSCRRARSGGRCARRWPLQTEEGQNGWPWSDRG